MTRDIRRRAGYKLGEDKLPTVEALKRQPELDWEVGDHAALRAPVSMAADAAMPPLQMQITWACVAVEYPVDPQGLGGV